MNIVLIGMPAVGKSTIGVILAKILGYKFLDSDLLIQEREKRLLRDIIESEGVDGFLAVENEVNASIDIDGSIIATGGSVVYCTDAMEHFRETSKIVYLRIEYDEIVRRLVNISNRGVVLRDGQSLKDIYDERTILYEKYADVIIDELPGETAEDTIRKIIKAMDL